MRLKNNESRALTRGRCIDPSRVVANAIGIARVSALLPRADRFFCNRTTGSVWGSLNIFSQVFRRRQRVLRA